jgi:hypothetical protein
MLGAQVPGATGGLPAQGGLSVTKNPMAEQLQSYGRGDDSMLVHMTPGEVGGLQQLAMAAGGSLTINPETGLPEAGFLGKLLPTILGAALAATGIGAPLAAGIVGGGQTLLTGDINKGLMAGLGAFGGGALAGAAGLGAAGGAAKAAAANAAAGTALPGATGTAANIGAGITGTPGISGAAANLASAGAPVASTGLGTLGTSLAPASGLGVSGIGTGAAAAKTGLAGFGQRFGQAASAGLGGTAAKYAPYAAGYGLLNAASEASTPTLRMPEEEKSDYKGPYLPQPRKARFRTPEEMRQSGGAEFSFFEDANPYPGFMPAPGMAEGGLAALPAAGDFQATLDFFNQSPGAITASMYPTASARSTGSTGRSTGEKAYTFAQGNTPFVPGTGIPGSGGETLASLLSSFSGNGGSGASFSDLANMFGGRMSSEIAPNPPPDMSMANSLPGTKIDAVKVSGDGVMPDFKLDPLSINPVEMPQINVSSGYGASGSMGNYRGEFGGSSPFSNTGGNLNSMGSFGNNLDSRITGGNYTLPTYTPPFTLPPLTLPKNPDEYEELKARGGEVGMDDGSFVVDARTVSELGNGSSNAGIEHLARMGGRPVRGAGDGVSDSVPARIGGSQKARVARDEVIFSPEAVSRLGSGSHSKGTKKLYALMSKAHSARKKAGRGQDTKVAKGLGALR